MGCTHMCHGAHVGRVEDNYMESVLSFHFSVGSEDQTHVIRLERQVPFPSDSHQGPTGDV